MHASSSSSCRRPSPPPRQWLLLMFSLTLLLSCLIAVRPVSASAPLPSAGPLCLSGATPLRLADECAPGWYCPRYNASEPATFPVMCTPTNECMMDRITSRFCDAQGTYEPTLCKEGFYCPTPLEQLECPAGHLCVQGQYEPMPCGPLSSCPAGSSERLQLSGTTAIVVIDGAFVLAWIAARAWKRRHLRRRDETDAELKVQGAQGSRKDVLDALVPQGITSTPAHSAQLCEGFQRAHRDLPPMLLQFDSLSLTIPSSRGTPLTILKGVTGSLQPAKVTAVMGPSGAGKTTFLHTMLGAVNPEWKRGGSLLINGVAEDLGRFRKIIGYVPQEDVMQRELTVYDNIRYSAALRLPRDWSALQQAEHVSATISAMQLTHVQDSPIGDELTRGVSGGQRKRCNIGMEVAAAPSLLLLDEPTSGLDATAAMEICQVLKELAATAHITVCMVVHQPRVEIWQQLDELLLLAPGGLTVYQGPQRVAVAYFRHRFAVHIVPNDNPADALMDHIAQRAEEFVKGWQDGGPACLQDVCRTQEIEESERQTHSETKAAYSGPQAYSSPRAYAPSGPGPASENARSPSRSPSSPTPPASYGSADGAAVRIEVAASTAPGQGSDSGLPPAAEQRTKRRLRAAPVSGVVPAPFGPSPLRLTASFPVQTLHALVRSLWKQLSTLRSLALEAGLGLFAGRIMGALMKVRFQGIFQPPYTLLSPSPLETSISSMMSTVGLALSLAAATAGVNVFGEEVAVYRREAAAGHSHAAYYLGVSLAQLPRLILDALHFTFVFHMAARPLTSFADFLAVIFLYYLAIYGLAAIVSFVVSRRNASLLAVVICLIFTGMTMKGGQPEPIQYLSAARWGAEAIFGRQTQPFKHVYQVDEAAERLGYNTDRFSIDCMLMFLLAVLYRAVAYAIMRWQDRHIIAKE